MYGLLVAKAYDFENNKKVLSNEFFAQFGPSDQVTWLWINQFSRKYLRGITTDNYECIGSLQRRDYHFVIYYSTQNFIIFTLKICEQEVTIKYENRTKQEK